MSKERQFPSGRVSEQYSRRVETLANQPPVVPVVERYDLSSQRGWLQWEEAMRETGKFSSTNIEGMINEATDPDNDAPPEKRPYVDRYPQHLKDIHKIDKIAEPVDDYVKEQDIWNDTTIIRRPWREKEFVRVAHETEHDRVADSRSIFIFPDSTREKIRTNTLATAGAGVGGWTTYLWALSGGKQIRISDNGELGPHKLNRFPGGDIGELGENQAVLLAQLIYEASPYANVLCKPEGLGDGKDGTYSMKDFFSGATIGVEAMDNLLLKGEARKIMKDLEVPWVMPTDLNRDGFVGFNDKVLERLTPAVRQQMEDPTIEHTTKTDLAIDVFIGPNAPVDMVEPLHHARDPDTGVPYWPQVGIAAFVSAAGAVYTMLRYLEGAENIPAERPIRLGWE